jgi:hypothetical protein
MILDQASLTPRKRAQIDALAANPSLQDAITWLRTNTPIGRLNELETFELLAAMVKGPFTITFRGKAIL